MCACAAPHAPDGCTSALNGRPPAARGWQVHRMILPRDPDPKVEAPGVQHEALCVLIRVVVRT